MSTEQWDAFMSHASEDKDFVFVLVTALGHMGVKVWLDRINIQLGDDLSRSIDEGLAHSRFGLVLISKDFLKKKWTDYELRGLINRESNSAVSRQKRKQPRTSVEEWR